MPTEPPKLCNECGSKWVPVSIDKLAAFFGQAIQSGNGVPHVYAFKRNLAYSFQYLQYLSHTKKELNLTSVLINQTNKSFIVHGCSIVECLIYYYVRSNGHHKENEWELVKEAKTPNFVLDGETMRLENSLYRKLKIPAEEMMTFDTLIKKCRNKSLLGVQSDIYTKLNYLRKLRNRVHLQTIESALDHDWNKIDYSDFKLMNYVLFFILNRPEFKPNTEQKQFLAFLDLK